MSEDEYREHIAKQKRLAREDLSMRLLAWRRLYWTWLNDPIEAENRWRRDLAVMRWRTQTLAAISVLNPRHVWEFGVVTGV